MNNPPINRHCLLGLSFLLVLLGAGCRMVRSVADVPGQAVRAVTPGQNGQPAVDPVEVQQSLLRFADQFATRMVLGVDQLRRGANALAPAEALHWKLALAGETCSIASRPNAIADLLDITILVTVSRRTLEEYWQPKVFGESAQPMLESCRHAETEIWQLAGTVLTPAQQVELRQGIEAWLQLNPTPESVLGARALGFTSRVAAASRPEAGQTASVFSLLRMDPLAGMDPAVREITQTRMLAERALFVSQKMPMLLRWQTELLSVNALAMPAVQQWVTNSTQIAASVDRFAAVAEKLPGQISTEREEMLKALESQEKNLAPLVNEVRQTLAAGSQMSTSLNTTITAFDTLMKRFGVGETNAAGPPKTNTEPFRIQDYGRTAEKLEATARQLTELLVTLDRTIGSTNLAKLSAQVAPAVQQAQAGGKEVVDYAFWKGMLLTAIVLAAGLIYRFLVPRITATDAKSAKP